MKLLLFDIDGTLLLTGGAASNAVDKAFERLYNVKNIMSGIKVDGKTDPIILEEMFKKGLNREFSSDEAEFVFHEYISLLDAELEKAENFRVMPGIYDLLDYLVGYENILLGIATGNIEQGAWAKLKYCGLHNYFSFGGFGSDSANREQLIRVAIKRANIDCDNSIESTYVIGDTPLDIIHGRAAGALTVGVSTGSYTYLELEKYNPDFLFNDLKNTKAFLGIINI